MNLPLCFVVMPFGRKSSPEGLVIDFDQVYQQLIAPAIEAAELEPLRADEDEVGGFIHKPMFERLILCEFAVADLTLANPTCSMNWAFGMPCVPGARCCSWLRVAVCP